MIHPRNLAARRGVIAVCIGLAVLVLAIAGLVLPANAAQTAGAIHLSAPAQAAPSTINKAASLRSLGLPVSAPSQASPNGVASPDQTGGLISGVITAAGTPVPNKQVVLRRYGNTDDFAV